MKPCHCYLQIIPIISELAPVHGMMSFRLLLLQLKVSRAATAWSKSLILGPTYLAKLSILVCHNNNILNSLSFFYEPKYIALFCITNCLGIFICHSRENKMQLLQFQAANCIRSLSISKLYPLVESFSFLSPGCSQKTKQLYICPSVRQS